MSGNNNVLDSLRVLYGEVQVANEYIFQAY